MILSGTGCFRGDFFGKRVSVLAYLWLCSYLLFRQNCFYKDFRFHVYHIDYIWVVQSKDGGRTWEHASMIYTKDGQNWERTADIADGGSAFFEMPLKNQLCRIFEVNIQTICRQ